MFSWKGRNRAGEVLGSIAGRPDKVWSVRMKNRQVRWMENSAGRPVEKEGLITMENSNFAVIYDCKNHCIVKTHPGGYLKNAKNPLILG